MEYDLANPPVQAYYHVYPGVPAPSSQPALSVVEEDRQGSKLQPVTVFTWAADMTGLTRSSLLILLFWTALTEDSWINEQAM